MNLLYQAQDAIELQERFAEATAAELLLYAADRFGDLMKLACSLGAEDMVLVDLLAKVAPGSRVFVLDTGRLHPETYEVLERARERYDLRFEVLFPISASVEDLTSREGLFSFRQSVEARKECCGIRKVEPLNRALAGLEAWITGLRREQAVTRATLPKVELDADHGGIFKLNPLADWTEEQVWDYIRANNVPYNALHDQGFRSIGCAPCTRPTLPGEDVRAGRWWWESPEHKECGLHVRKTA